MTKRILLFFVILHLIKIVQSASAFPIIEWDTAWVINKSSTDISLWASGLEGDAIVACLLQHQEHGAELIATGGTIGNAYQFVKMNYGDAITYTTIMEASDVFASIMGPSSILGDIYFPLAESVYIGFLLYDLEYRYEYGWVELMYDGSGVKTIASASEKTGIGIYCGTGIAIPEPGTMGLILLGGIGLFMKRRKRQLQM